MQNVCYIFSIQFSISYTSNESKKKEYWFYIVDNCSMLSSSRSKYIRFCIHAIDSHTHWKLIQEILLTLSFCCSNIQRYCCWICCSTEKKIIDNCLSCLIHIIKSCLLVLFNHFIQYRLLNEGETSLPPIHFRSHFEIFVLFNMLVAVILLKIRKLLQKKMCIVVAAMEYLYAHTFISIAIRHTNKKKYDKQTLGAPQNLIHWAWFVVYSRWHIINIVTIAQARTHTHTHWNTCKLLFVMGPIWDAMAMVFFDIFFLLFSPFHLRPHCNRSIRDTLFHHFCYL